MGLILYSNPLSTYCTRVRFFLAEAGHDFFIRNVDLGAGEQLHRSYLNHYDLSKVPSIDYNGFRLGESNAIMRYLAHKWERYDLYPLQLEARAEVDQWVDFATQHICKYIGELVWYRAWAAKFGQRVDPQVDARAERFLLSYMSVLNRSLEGRHVLCGTTLSIADISLLPFLDIFPKAKLPLHMFPDVARYTERLQHRAAWQKTADS